MVLADEEDTRLAIFRAYKTTAVFHPNPIGSCVKEAARLMANNWIEGLELAGMNLDTVDDVLDTDWDLECPFKIAYVGYSNTPDQRFEAHEWERQDHPKSLVHVVCAVASDVFGNKDFAWKGHAVWTAWEGEWAKGKMAELIVAELVSMSAGVYAWEAGMNTNVSPCKLSDVDLRRRLHTKAVDSGSPICSIWPTCFAIHGQGYRVFRCIHESVG
jgi:hypothetical protein